MSSDSIITPPTPAASTVAGSALPPTVASSHAATPASVCAVPNLLIKEETPLHPSSAALMAAPPASSISVIEQHHDIYFRLKATSASDAGTHKFAGASRLCVSLLAHLSSIPCLAKTGLFSPGNIRLTISKHHTNSAKCFLYTASFVTTGTIEALAEASITVTDVILQAQSAATACADERKPPSTAKGFIFDLPTVTPNGNAVTCTRCSFSYDRETLLGLTTVDFQIKIPSSVSISPQEDFALLIAQLITPRGSLSETEYLLSTKADRIRFAGFCFPRKTFSTAHGDWMDELMMGSFSLNFEDADSRDILIWNFLIFAAFFGLDPRFGNHQQYQLYIPTLHDQHALDRRPTAMRDAVKSFKANQAINDLLPSKPRRNRPKHSDATSSEAESEALFFDNIVRRSEALLLLQEVPLFESFSLLHYPLLTNAPFTHILKIPLAPVIALVPTLASVIPLSSALDPLLNTALSVSLPTIPFTLPQAPKTVPPCFSWAQNSSCKLGTRCKFIHTDHIVQTSNLTASHLTDNFIGEGKKDIACRKFSEHRCLRGTRCPYRHDIRDVLSSSLQLLSLTHEIPAATIARRMQAASPAKGAAQLASLLDSFCRPGPLTSLVKLVLEPLLPLRELIVVNSPPFLGSPIMLPTQSKCSEHSPSLPPSKSLGLIAQPPRRIKLLSPTPLAPRISRSLPPSNIGALEGFCTQGHKIFKRTPSKNGSMRRCSFCKSPCEGYTCFCGASHSCLQCLIDHKTAPPPPPCAAEFCNGICAIQALTHSGILCWIGGHSLKKGSEAWQCRNCSFTICRSCSLRAKTPDVTPSTPPTLPPPEAVGSSESSATASAPMPP
jgi:hypothetical protein